MIAPLFRVLIAMLMAIAIALAPLRSQSRPAEQLEEQLTEARARLAREAFDDGLLREAGALIDAVLAAQPEHELGLLLFDIKKLSGEEFAEIYARALDEHGRAFRRKTRDVFEPIADEFYRLGEAGLGEDAERCLTRAYELDPDHPKVLKALRKLDYEAIFNYGVLPRDDKDSARRTLRSLGGRLLGRADLNAELEFWSDAWGMQTRHYRFVTNANHATVFEFAEACEQLHASWELLLRVNRQPLRDSSKPYTVYLFRSKIDYETVLRVRGQDPWDSEDVLGFYSPRTSIGYFFYDESFYRGDRTRLIETFFHEGSHQLIDRRLKYPWRGLQDKQPLCWVEEGFCVYVESLADGVFGGLIDDDLGIGIEAADEESLRSIDEFAHIDSRGWDAYEVGYQHAVLVVHWLMHGDGGKRRRVLFDLLAAERGNGGLREGTFFDLVMMRPEQVDTALRGYAAELRRTLPRRRYAK